MLEPPLGGGAGERYTGPFGPERSTAALGRKQTQSCGRASSHCPSRTAAGKASQAVAATRSPQTSSITGVPLCAAWAAAPRT